MIAVTLLIGFILRLWEIDLPDLATDEAQFILGASAAHPPLGMLLFQGALFLHHSITAVRMVSVLAGMASVGVLFVFAQRTESLRTAGIVATVAAVFPGHMLYSKVACLDPLLMLSWLLTLLTLEQARASKEKELNMPLLFLWMAATASTFIKAQGFLFPLALLLLRAWEMRRNRPWHDPVTGILACSLLPAAAYLLTSPDIVATVQLYGGNTFGLHNLSTRILEVFRTWWQTLLLILPLGILSLPLLRRLHWPVISLCITASFLPLLLGPTHANYTTEMVIFALPIGLLITRLPRVLQGMTLGICIGSALLLQMQTPTTYWNTHSDILNAQLAREERIIAVGPTGHHVRWYLRPEVLVGTTMDLSQWSGILMDLGTNQVLPAHTVLYQDKRLRLLQVNEP